MRGLPSAITSTASVITAPSTQPPETEPRKLPSSSMTRWLPTGRGAEPQVSTTVASATAAPGALPGLGFLQDVGVGGEHETSVIPARTQCEPGTQEQAQRCAAWHPVVGSGFDAGASPRDDIALSRLSATGSPIRSARGPRRAPGTGRPSTRGCGSGGSRGHAAAWPGCRRPAPRRRRSAAAG